MFTPQLAVLGAGLMGVASPVILPATATPYASTTPTRRA